MDRIVGGFNLRYHENKKNMEFKRGAERTRLLISFESQTKAFKSTQEKIFFSSVVFLFFVLQVKV